jgi:hypothetical protein
MFSKLHERLGTAGLVVAVVALVVALAGTAIAALPGLNSKQKKQVTKIAKKYAGQDGATGPQGPAGAPGAPGPEGKQGLPGTNGTNGTDGEDGEDGTDGVDGKNVETIPFDGTEEPPTEPCEERGGVLVGPEGTEPENMTPVCKGEAGEEGSPWTAGGTLPSGATLTGSWSALIKPGEENQEMAPISFSIPLSAEIEAAKVVTHVKNYNGEAKDTEEKEICPGKAANPQAKAGYLCVYTANPTSSAITMKGIFKTGSGTFTAGASKTGAYLLLETAIAQFSHGTWAVTAP